MLLQWKSSKQTENNKMFNHNNVIIFNSGQQTGLCRKLYRDGFM